MRVVLRHSDARRWGQRCLLVWDEHVCELLLHGQRGGADACTNACADAARAHARTHAKFLLRLQGRLLAELRESTHVHADYAGTVAEPDPCSNTVAFTGAHCHSDAEPDPCSNTIAYVDAHGLAFPGTDAKPDAKPDEGAIASTHTTDTGASGADRKPDAGALALANAGADAGADAVPDAVAHRGPDAVADAEPDAGSHVEPDASPDARHLWHRY